MKLDVSLATLRGGAVVEMVDDALRKVAENIADPNTKGKAKRSVTLKLTLLPDEDRDLVGVVAAVQVGLAPTSEVTAKLWLSRTREGLTVTEDNPHQRNLYEPEEQPPADGKLRAVGRDD